jgi:hypothetical protein
MSSCWAERPLENADITRVAIPRNAVTGLEGMDSKSDSGNLTPENRRGKRVTQEIKDRAWIPDLLTALGWDLKPFFPKFPVDFCGFCR